jgi:hypothetical protein
LTTSLSLPKTFNNSNLLLLLCGNHQATPILTSFLVQIGAADCSSTGAAPALIPVNLTIRFGVLIRPGECCTLNLKLDTRKHTPSAKELENLVIQAVDWWVVAGFWKFQCFLKYAVLFVSFIFIYLFIFYFISVFSIFC